jgi:sec-independent protein translocase protein TatA
MFGLSVSHLLILLVVILLFGARRLPELGDALGKSINAFKKGLEGKSEEKKTELADKRDDSDTSGPRGV